MGQSITLLQKEFLTFSVEIDRDVSIEMSTGFGANPRVTTVTNMPVTLVELGDIINRLQEIKVELDKHWVCPECKSLNPDDEKECVLCDKPRS